MNQEYFRVLNNKSFYSMTKLTSKIFFWSPSMIFNTNYPLLWIIHFQFACINPRLQNGALLIHIQFGALMTSWFTKSECVGNVDKVKDFYNRVLADFLEKIYKENRFKMSGGLDEQKIEQLGEQVRAFLKRPAHLFQKCIDMKEGSSRLEEAIKNEIINERYIPELKIEHEDDHDNYLAVPPKNGNEPEDKQEEEIEDDLADYVDGAPEIHRRQQDKKREGEVKRQDNVIDYHVAKSEVKIQQGDSQSEVDKNELTITECEQFLNCIVLGTFNANTIKHKPKEEKTSIDLDNVFVKWPAGETFFGQINMEATKMEKETIRKDFPMKRRNSDH